MPPWWLTLCVPAGVAVGLAGVRLMSADARWWFGYALVWLGFGSLPVQLLIFWRWRLLRFRAMRVDGSRSYFTRQDLDEIHRTNPTLSEELMRLNPELEEWWMTADFPPWPLRRIVLRRVTIRIPWLHCVLLASHAAILPMVPG